MNQRGIARSICWGAVLIGSIGLLIYASEAVLKQSGQILALWNELTIFSDQQEWKKKEVASKIEPDWERSAKEASAASSASDYSTLYEKGVEKLSGLTSYLNSPPKSPAAAECRRVLRSRGVLVGENSPCILVDDVMRNLPSAMYQFNKPEVAYVDEPFRVVMVLPTAPDQDIASFFKSTEGDVVKKKARYAQYMEATLHGDVDLKVSPSTPQPRTITALEPTVWEWTVIPQKPGNKTLVIDVDAQLVVGTRQERVQLRTLHEDIHVKVHLTHQVLAFFSSLQGMLVSLATIAIGGLGVLHLVKPKKVQEIPGAAELMTHQLHDKSHSDTQSHGG
jgi:hypothetical protein